MSSVDERIVKMTFDNKQFESGVQTTLNSLDELKKSSTFDGISKGVESLQKRFSTMGIVGMEVTRRITNAAIDSAKKLGDMTLGQIKSGGMTRALNIEQARFQLQGLFAEMKNGDKMAEKVLDKAKAAVKGTAYGLDEAAKAASVLAASNVPMSKMEPVLTSIAGAAAMTGRSFDDISNIYSTVASNGKLMTMQLRQFSAAGLNVSAVLSKYYHKSEAEINDMVTKGKVSFDDFSNAMLQFGKQAKRANETFSGSLANMKAALNRLGEQFATPYLQNARDIFNAITPAIDEVGEALKPFSDQVAKDMAKVKNALVDFFTFLAGDTEKHVGPLKDLTQGLINILTSLKRAVTTSFGHAFKDIFPNATLQNLGEAIKRFREISQIIGRKLTSQTGNFKDGFSGLFTVIKAVIQVFGFLKSAVDAVTRPFGGLIGIIGGIIGTFGRAVQSFYDFVSGSELLRSAANNVINFLGKASKAIHDFVSSSRFLQTVNSIIHGVGVGLTALGKGFSFIFNSIKDSSIFEKLGNGLGKFKESIKGLFSGKGFDFSFITDGISNLSYKIISGFSKVIDFFAHIDFGKVINTGIGVAIATAITKIGSSIKFLTYQLTLAKNNVVKLPLVFKNLAATMRYELNARKLKQQAIALLLYAGAVAVLVVAVKALAKLNTGDLFKGLVGVYALFKILDVEMGNLKKSLEGSKTKGMLKAAASMILLSAAVKSLAKAASALGSLDLGSLVKGLIGVRILLAGLNQFLNKTDFKGFGVTKGLGLMAVAESMKIMSKAVASFGSMNLETLAKGLISIGVLLTAISGALRLAGNPKHMIAMGTGMVLMAAAMIVFAKATESFGNLSIETIAKGLGSIVIVLAALTAAVNLMPAVSALAIGVALVAMSVGILAIAGALKILSTISIAQMGTALLGVVAPLAALGLVAALVSPVSLIATAAAIVIFAAGIAVLTPPLLAFSQLSLESILKALVMLAGVLLTLGIAAMALGPVAPLMILLGVGIATLGAGVLVTAAGLMLLAAAFTALAAAGTAGAAVLVAAFIQIVEGIVTMVPTIATAIAEAILTFVATIAEHGAEVVDMVVKLGTAILDGIIQLVPKLVSAGMSLIMGLLTGIAQNIGKIAAMGGRIIVSFIQGIAAMIGPIIQAGINLMLSFILGLANGIRDNSELFFDALGSLVEAMLEMFITALEKMASHIPVVGKKISKGLKGIKEDMRDTFDVEETNKKFKKSMEDNQKAVEELAPDFKMAGQNSKNALKEGASGLGADMGALGKDGIQSMLDSFAAGEIDLEAAGIKLDDATKKGLQNGTLKSSDVADQLMAEYNASLSKGGEKAKGKAKKIGDDSAAAFGSGNDKAKKEGEKKAQSYAAGISPKDVLKNIKSIMTAAAQAFSDRTAVAQVKTSGVKTVEMFASAIKGAKSQANNAGKTAASNAGTGFKSKDAYNTSNAAGINLGAGFVKGIKAKDQAAYDAGYNQGKKAAQGQKDGAKESSPSKIAIQTGKYLGEGLVIGIRSMNRTVYKAGYNMGDQAATSLSAAMSKVYDTINSDMDFNPTITPVLDLSNVQNGINSMNGMLDTRRISARVSGNMSRVGLRQQLALASGPQSTTNNTNTFNITVDGAGDPIDVANEIVNQIQLVTRMS